MFVCVCVLRSEQSSIGFVFLIHKQKLLMYEQYIMASPRSIMTLDTWRKKEPELITLFQVPYDTIGPCG